MFTHKDNIQFCICIKSTKKHGAAVVHNIHVEHFIVIHFIRNDFKFTNLRFLINLYDTLL